MTSALVIAPAGLGLRARRLGLVRLAIKLSSSYGESSYGELAYGELAHSRIWCAAADARGREKLRSGNFFEKHELQPSVRIFNTCIEKNRITSFRISQSITQNQGQIEQFLISKFSNFLDGSGSDTS